MSATPTVSVRTDAVFERVWLDERSWVDVARGWLDGADELYATLAEGAAWRQGKLFRYERWMDEPRLTASVGRDPSAWHPALLAAHRDLRSRYKVDFEAFTLAWYRNERDSVAFHRDRDMRWLDNTVIALLSLGARRPWQLRPRANRYDHEAADHGATIDLQPGSGDLLVMGGQAQLGWEHSVPKVAHRVEGRVSVQWRWTDRRGRMEQGGSFRSPRTFGR